MAGLQSLVSLIYHEKQQSGSMLCAQHALNNLLQGNYFTAPDLSEIAHSLDTLEQSYDDSNSGRTSTNMDDTGFFSIQVLDKALDVWGLNLTRWRSEAMRSYQDHPHTQIGFVLNLQQHWFTLRRFGHITPNGVDPGNGHWFNLDSFLGSPEWVGKLYLSMVLQQAESDGYSVFAVTQADPSKPLNLPHTEADDMASTLPEPSSTRPPTTRVSDAKPPISKSSSSQQTQSKADPEMEYNFDDEDFELQAVLQATLMGSGSTSESLPSSSFSAYPPIPGSLPSESEPGATSGPSGGATLTHRYGAPGQPRHSTSGREVDPVAESMTRNRMIMKRMQREQELAQRELYEEEVARFGRQRNADVEDEEEMLLRAIAESNTPGRTDGHVLTDDEDAEGNENEGESSIEPDPVLPYHMARNSSGDVRVYDDDDTALQQALKASLETLPEGFTVTFPPPTRTDVRVPTVVTDASVEEEDMEDVDSSSERSVASPEPAEVSVDELRKRRLARFG